MDERTSTPAERIAELEAEVARLRAAEAAREKAFALHKQIVKHTPIGLLLARLEEPGNPGSFRFLWGNDIAFAAGYASREQVEGARLDTDMPAIIEAGLADIYYRALVTGETQEGPSFAYNDPEGLPAFYDVRVGRVDKDTVAIYYNNVTLRERQLQDLQAANKALRQSNKELERFAAVASHDLKAPLRNIQGFLGLLQEECSDQLNDDGKLFVAEALGATARLDTTVKGLLDIAQLGTQKRRETVDLNVMLDELRHDLSLSLNDAQGTLTIDRMPSVVADPGQLRQLFLNLLTNCFRYRRPQVPLQIHIGVAQKNDRWQFSIADNGIGVAPQYAKRIFGMFQRLHREDEIKGVGLGLSICQRVVEGHGGEIWLSQKQPPGATVLFTLPTNAAAARVGRFEAHTPQETTS